MKTIEMSDACVTTIRQALNQASAENRSHAGEARATDQFDLARAFDRLADLQDDARRHIVTQTEG